VLLFVRKGYRLDDVGSQDEVFQTDKIPWGKVNVEMSNGKIPVVVCQGGTNMDPVRKGIAVKV
jgi:hypothetical protein